MERNIWKEKGLKSTKSRQLILGLLEEATEPMTAEEIFIKTRERKSLNFSTVYRTLSILSEKDVIVKNHGAEGKAYFQINREQHSHFLVCTECKKRVPIEGCPLEEIGKNLIKKTGFHITGHNLEFRGECPDCLEKHPAK